MLRSEPSNPKYIQIARRLRAEIEEGYRPGDVLPSERALYRRFGVNLKTVRSALAFLQDEGIVHKSAGRRTVVLARSAPSAGDVVPPPTGAGRRVLGLVLPMEPYLVAVLVPAVEREACRHGFATQVCGTRTLVQIAADPGAAREHEAAALRALAVDGVAGAVWWSAFGRDNAEVARSVQREGVPLALVDNTIPGLAADWVGIDDYEAARQVTRHLVSQGYRDTVFWAYGIGDFVPPLDTERILGYLDTMRDVVDFGRLPVSLVGLSVPDLLDALPAAARERIFFHGRDSLSALLGRGRPPSALLASNDHLAQAVLRDCAALCVRVPDDLAIASFGDIARYTGEASILTSVEQPFDQIAQRAVRLLVQRVADPSRPVQHVHLPTRLMVRRSTRALGAVAVA
jgi:DNA-binding LacI/PurR family transcriptional regulator